MRQLYGAIKQNFSWLRTMATVNTFQIAADMPLDTWVMVGLYPIVTLQHSSTTSYQVSYHIRYLFFESDNRILP